MAVGQLTALANAVVTTAAGTSISCTVPNDGSVVVGDLLLWTVVIASGSRPLTLSGISNSTLAGSASQSGHASTVWYKVAQAGDLGVTITATQNGVGGVKMGMLLGKVSGADTTNPFDVGVKIASNTSAASTTKTTPSVTTVAAGSREISIVADSRNPNPSSSFASGAPSGETFRDQAQTATDASNQESTIAWGDSDSTVSGTVGSRVWTASATALGSSWTLAVKAGGSTFNETPTDSEGITDSLGLTQTETFTKSDSEGITDSLGLIQTEIFTKSDTEGITDSASLAQTEVFTKSDALGLTDSLSLLLGTGLPYSDSEGLTDNLSTAQTGRAVLSESLGLTDSLNLTLSGSAAPIPTGRTQSLVLGPATLYIAPFGAVEPTNSLVASAPDPLVWTDLGGILGGVDLSVEQEWMEVELKQLPDRPMKRLKKRRLSIKTALAEPTLANLSYALNESAPVSGAFEVSNRSEASVLSYNALIVDGWAPGSNAGGRHKRRRIIVRKCLSIDNVELGYTKDGQSVYTVTWSCHYVDSVTPIFRVVDEA